MGSALVVDGKGVVGAYAVVGVALPVGERMGRGGVGGRESRKAFSRRKASLFVGTVD